MFEDQSSTAIHALEMKIRHLQAEHDKYKAIAMKWEPKLTVVSDVIAKKTTFGLEFGGKFIHADVSDDYLVKNDSTSATTAIVETLIESLVVPQLRTIVAPELERIHKNAAQITGAGKW